MKDTEIIQQQKLFRKTKILVIGESCLDRFIYCETSRLSPEAPVPVLVPIEVVENMGMSGNVVQNLFSINKKIDVVQVFQEEEITKTRYVEKKSNHMFFRIDEGERTKITPFEAEENPKDFDIVIVSDYNKGFLKDSDLLHIGKASKLSILDSKRKLSSEIIESFTFVKMNEGEAKQNGELSSKPNVIVTLGPKGARFNRKVYESPSPKETIDVSGAGDTFTSSFILKYYETKNIDQSIIFANEMSSIVVSKRGVATP